jgi:TolA-binding protein
VTDIGIWYLVWLKEFFNAQIIIDKGSSQGVKRGDYFVVKEEKEVHSSDGRILGILPEENSLIQVVDVQPNFSICQFMEYFYKNQLKALKVRLAKVRDKNNLIDLQKHVELLAPVTVGQKVEAISQEEKAQWNEIEEAYNQTLVDSISAKEKKFHYEDIINKADEFMLEHSNGHFAPDALFNKGFAQLQLQQYSESIDTFELFLKHYPWHVSAPGAEKWIEKARKSIRQKKA